MCCIRYASHIVRRGRSRGDGAIDLHEPTPTRRQLEILALMADGKSREQIAALLYVEVTTIRTHLNDLYKRIGIAAYGNPGYKAISLYVSGCWS